MPSTRATASTGAVVDDPGPGELAGLVRELASGGAGAFLILQGPRDRRGQAYLQAVNSRGSYVVERQDAAGTRLYRAAAGDIDSLIATFVAWSAGARSRCTGLEWTLLESAPAW